MSSSDVSAVWPSAAVKKQLTYDLYGAHMAGESRHPQVVIKELGIRYEHATPQSLGDCWWLWNCEFEGELPAFISVVDRDPMDCIGYGLSEEVAKRLTNSLNGC